MSEPKPMTTGIGMQGTRDLMSASLSERKTNSNNRFGKMYHLRNKETIATLKDENKEMKDSLENKKLELKETRHQLYRIGEKVNEMEGLIKSYEDKEKELRKFESELLDSYGAKLIAPLIRFIQLIISNNPISVNKKLIQLKRILNVEKIKFDELEKKYNEQGAKQAMEIRNYSLELSRLEINIQALIKEKKQYIEHSDGQIVTDTTQRGGVNNDSKYDTLIRKMIPCPENIREVLEVVRSRTMIKITEEAMKKSKKCEFSHSITAMEYLFYIEKRYLHWCKSGKSGEFNPRNGVDGPTIDYARNDSKDRFWNYKGRRIKANKHVKIGVEWNQKKTLRIYFEIIEDELVVFYVGKHP